MTTPTTAADLLMRVLQHARNVKNQPLIHAKVAAEYIADVQAEARAAAGHRIADEHDCFLMNCKALGPEVERVIRFGGVISAVEHANAAGVTVHVATRATCAEHIEAGDDEATAFVGPDAQIVALRKAFTAYGQHQQPCEYGPAVRCTCGYIDTLRGLTR